MDFVKKNWGFLAIAVVCFVVAIGIIVYWLQANKTLAAHQAETAKQLEFFDRVKGSNINLSQDNITVTENNLRIATEHFNNLQLSLAEKSHIEPEVPATPLEAVRVLKSEITALQKALADGNVLITDGNGWQMALFILNECCSKLIALHINEITNNGISFDWHGSYPFHNVFTFPQVGVSRSYSAFIGTASLSHNDNIVL